jgi:hypothetical protein
MLTLQCTSIVLAEATVGPTEVLGPFTGEGAPLHPDNLSPHRIEYYGTDLGWSYEHGGQLHFLFGDTMATEAKAEPIEASSGEEYDDCFGTVDLEKWADPDRITRESIPLLKLGQNPGTSEASAINPGHPLGLFKTPMGAFSSGRREFAVFFTAKPLGCRTDDDCVNGLSCDTGLGYVGERFDNEDGLTLACIEGTSEYCNADTMTDAEGRPIENSGLCTDRSSSMWGATGTGRTNSMAYKVLIGMRSTENPGRYTDTREWYTNKFYNLAVRTVERFEPSAGTSHSHQNYNPARGSGGNQRVLLWGRPGFVGVGKKGMSLGLYFAYVDLPRDGGFSWHVHYYTGVDENGVPQFSTKESAAVPVDLNATVAGEQRDAEYDIVDQNTFAWVDHLKKWIMFFGGGVSTLPIEPTLTKCGLIELFSGPDCAAVDLGNGAIRMRSADNPWGPWSPAQDVVVGGDPSARPLEGHYRPGGMLRHPECSVKGCAPHTDTEIYSLEKEYGFFYGPNIIESWVKPAGDGVDVVWNLSTWDPYRVILLRTRINP